MLDRVADVHLRQAAEHHLEAARHHEWASEYCVVNDPVSAAEETSQAYRQHILAAHHESAAQRARVVHELTQPRPLVHIIVVREQSG